MKNYIKKVWKLLAWGLALGLTLTILLENVPIRFMLSVMIFIVIIGEFVEWEKSLAGFNELVKKVAWLSAFVIVFVWFRAIFGFFLGQPSARAYEDIASGGGALYLHKNSWTVNMMFELLYLAPGLAAAYLVIKGRLVWKIATVLCSTALLAWLSWTMQQPSHAATLKRQVQTRVNLDARRRSDHAAAAYLSFGIAKEPVGVFYQSDGTNVVPDLNLTNRVLQADEQVLRPSPDDPPIFSQGLAFTRVVLKNPNGSFLGGYNAWVEMRQFSWVDGRSASPVPAKRQVQEKIVPFTPGQPANTGLVVEPGDTVEYINPTAPFKVPGTNQFHLITASTSHAATGLGNVVIYGHETAGFVQIRVVPKL